MGYKIAVVGATGNVGRELLAILAEREFPADEVIALASERSVGAEVSFGEDDVLEVQELATFDFAGTDIVFSSPGRMKVPASKLNGAIQSSVGGKPVEARLCSNAFWPLM